MADPVLLISTISDENSITIYNAASSDKSLGIMLLMAAIGAPLVLSYTVFVYKSLNVLELYKNKSAGPLMTYCPLYLFFLSCLYEPVIIEAG